MATQSISPAAGEFEQFAAEQVASGEFSNAREVLEAAKAALARQKRYQEKLADLKQSIQEGIDSGVYEGDAFADVRRKNGLEATRRMTQYRLAVRAKNDLLEIARFTPE